MPLRHVLLALFVVVIWGINFIFVRLGLDEISPLFLCAFRFLLASIPAIFFLKRPDLPFKLLAGYGLTMFGLQFSLVFIGMNVGMTPGMASLLMQVQVFFTLFFAVFFLGDKPTTAQVVGAMVSFSGIILVAFHFDADVSVLGFVLILAASASWGVGNLLAKKIKTAHLISVVVWGSFVACGPMFLLAFLFEGSARLVTSYQHLSLKGVGALLYIVYVSTWVGYGIWNWLISKHPVGAVVPFTLLIPLVGMVSSVIVFGEPFQHWKFAAGLLIISGLGINILSTRLFPVKGVVQTA